MSENHDTDLQQVSYASLYDHHVAATAPLPIHRLAQPPTEAGRFGERTDRKTGSERMETMSTMRCSLLLLGCAFGFAPPAHQNVFTALRALKIAQRRLRPEVRTKLLSISSARSDASLAPPAWRFVFLDSATSDKCRVVTVAAKQSSEHPDTVEAFGSAQADTPATSHAIPQSKLLVDSDKALENIRAAMKLKGVHGAEFRLLQARRDSEPAWLVTLYGDDEKTPLGQFRVGAKTGTVEKG